MFGIFALMYALELGYQPISVQPEYAVEDSFYTELEARVYAVDTVFIGGNVRTDFVKAEAHMFSPFYTEYIFTAGIEIDNVTIAYEHMCQHSIINGDLYIPTYGGYDTFYFRIESKSPPRN